MEIWVTEAFPPIDADLIAAYRERGVFLPVRDRVVVARRVRAYGIWLVMGSKRQ
jgi:hypothetical protein